MENYKFKPKEDEDINIHWLIRLRSWLVSKHDSRALYKQFTTELHLDKLEKEDISYSLPSKSYPIVTNEISQWYGIRDRILLKMHHNNYATKQLDIDERRSELEQEHAFLKDSRVREKNDLDRQRNRLKAAKCSEDLIAAESRVSKAESRLQNTDSAIKNCEGQVSQLVRLKKDNLENWKKQVERVEKVIEQAIGKYIKRATTKIESNYGFTDFTHDVAKYDSEMKKVINGEY